jgi:hypothetical protein
MHRIMQGSHTPFPIHNSANEVSDMVRWRRSIGLFMLCGALSCGDAGSETPPAAAVCGDQVKQGDEQCDEGAMSAPRCAYGQTSCTVCDQRCQLVAGLLTGYCGDEIEQTASGEQCDEGRMPPDQCPVGAASCMVCNAQCQLVAGQVRGSCGDGVVQTALGEACDHDGAPSAPCAYGEESCMTCDAMCTLVPGRVTGFCGDGIIDAANAERCDPGVVSTCAASSAGVGLARCEDGCAGVDLSRCRDYKQVVVNDLGGCALDASGRVECWGALEPPAGRFSLLTAGAEFFCGVNMVGEVRCWGPSAPSLDVPSGGREVRSLAAGDDFVCALRSGPDDGDGSLDCSDGAPPINVPAVYEQLTAAAAHLCALEPDGTASCWGRDLLMFGHLNPPMSSFSQIATSRQLSCGVTGSALMMGQQLRCWGNDARRPPLSIINASTAQVSLSATHGCSLSPAGGARCWGGAARGASLVNAQLQWRSLALGRDASCGILSSGELVCWGDNTSGQTAPPMAPAQRIFATDGLSCAIGVDGGARCWGTNEQGRGLLAGAAVDLALGPEHTCALREGGRAECVGRSMEGQLELAATDRFSALAAGRGFTCGLLTDGAVRCVGDAGVVAQAPREAGFVKLAAAERFACAARQDGEVVCWGEGADIAPPDGLRAVSLSGGDSFMCALSSGGAARCWGGRGFAMLPSAGVKSLASAGESVCALTVMGVPVCFGPIGQLAAPPRLFTELAVGRRHVCGLDAMGAVTCWGDTGEGASIPPSLFK